MKHIILGTAGHVDHGKTALVRCISGVDTDRLKEEKARGISIELGFAPFVLPGGQRVSIVDVPGHERFVKTMLAGAAGFDLVLFVVAANEGVMPQTREHMDILRLLGIHRGLVALTKTDLVDAQWLALVREDVGAFLADSPLRGAPVTEISAVTGEGIPALLAILRTLCAETPERPITGPCRLAVDRVFSKTGFGTVVTGTLWSGLIRRGDLLELLPSQRQARVRALQVHGEPRDEAYAGERVAINLTGTEKQYLERGCWLAAPGTLRESHRVDIRLRLLPAAPGLAQHTRVHVHHGTAEALARVILLDCDALAPGEECFAQLVLEKPMAMLAGDRLVLRFYSPVSTIGGGEVLDATASRHKGRREEALARLTALHSGDPRRMLLAAMARDPLPRQLPDIAACLQAGSLRAQMPTGAKARVAGAQAGAEAEATAVEAPIGAEAPAAAVSPAKAESPALAKTEALVDALAETEALVDAMAAEGSLLRLPGGWFVAAEAAAQANEKLSTWLTDYLRLHPMRVEAPKQEATRVIFPGTEQKESREALQACFQYMDTLGLYEQDETTIRPIGWKPVFSGKQKQSIEAVRACFAEAPFAPPAWAEVAAASDILASEQAELLSWFVRSGELVRLTEDLVYSRSGLAEAERRLRESFPDGGFTLAAVRDLLGTARKHAEQICEYLDRERVTVRVGDKRQWT